MLSRLRNIILVVLCFLYFLRNGKADKGVGNPKKILVIQLAKMGDMVCTTPVFRAIKTKYPDVKLYVAGDRVNSKLLAGNSDIDEYIVWEKSDEGIRESFKSKNIDVAIMTGPGPETLAAIYMSGIPLVIAPRLKGGISPLKTISYASLSKFIKTCELQLGNYAPREYLKLLEPLGIFSDDTAKHLSFSADGEKIIDKFYIKNGVNPASDFVVGIFPSTGNKIKLWGREKFAEVADYLFEEYGAKIVLIGSDADKKEVSEFLSHVKKTTKIIDAANVFGVDELKALISKMSLLISVDTGPIYIAEAFGVATIDIVGPVDERDQPPVGTLHSVVVAPRKKPEMGVFNARVYDEKEARRQSSDITSEMVIKEARELIKLLGKPMKSR